MDSKSAFSIDIQCIDTCGHGDKRQYEDAFLVWGHRVPVNMFIATLILYVQSSTRFTPPNDVELCKLIYKHYGKPVFKN